MKKIFLLIFLAQIILFIIVPPFQIPDEPGHYENVIWLSRGKYPYQLLKKYQKYPYITQELENYYQTKFDFKKIINNPLRKKTKTEFEKNLSRDYQPINFQAYHPFLYYLLLTPGQMLTNILNADLITRFYLTRLISSLIFWLLIFSIYQTLKLTKTHQENIKSFFLFYALNPLIIYYSIAINPDLGVAIFSTVFLFLSIKFKEKLTYVKVLILGFIAGICYLNKTSGLTVFPFAIVYLFLINQSLKEKLKKLFIFLSVYFLTISPWIILSIIRYKTLSTSSFYIGHSGPINPNSLAKSVILALFEFRHTIMHYSGFLGGQNHLWPNKIYFISYTILVSSLFFIGFIRFFKKYQSLSLYLLSALFFLYSLGFYFKKAGFLWDLQGRFFLLAFFPFYFFVFLGLNTLRVSNFLIRVFSVLNFLLILFFLLIPNFYPDLNLIYALNTMYPYFGYFFIFALTLFLFIGEQVIFKLPTKSLRQVKFDGVKA